MTAREAVPWRSTTRALAAPRNFVRFRAELLRVSVNGARVSRAITERPSRKVDPRTSPWPPETRSVTRREARGPEHTARSPSVRTAASSRWAEVGTGFAVGAGAGTGFGLVTGGALGNGWGSAGGAGRAAVMVFST
ncbi:MAG: hypothetical protein EOP01_05830 [Propionibacteriaceae bacterium]|nr:MAG: hypothetical protein EOP01_05830 [Propionibacteriaceae bacterium]